MSRDDYLCGVQTPRMKGPCALWKGHVDTMYAPNHASRSAVNEDTPRMLQFATIVNKGLDQGITWSYVEIAERMRMPNLDSIRKYGLGARYTRLRQKIYKERGIAGNKRRRLKTPQQRIVEELKKRGEW